MWASLGSIGFFVVLMLIVGIHQWRSRRGVRAATPNVSKELEHVAEIAQRRSKKVYGKEDTGLHEALHGPHRKGKVHP